MGFMVIKQLSVFIENKQGRLAAVMNELAAHDIDVSALSLADTADFGVLRLIVNQPEKGREVLAASGVTVKITEMAAVVMDDEPGGAARAISLLAENGIEIEYMYACIGKVHGKALMVMRVDDLPRTERLLAEHGFGNVRPEDVYRIG